MTNKFNSKIRASLILGTILAGIAAPHAAFAQDGAAGDEIVVTGSIFQAQEASIDVKRLADNLVDVASADAVGRFPDENIAAALTRLPGVAV